MAAGVRVISLFGTGQFGADLTAALTGLPGARVVTAPDDATGVLVAAFWRPSPRMCAHIDTLGVPWLPVVLEGDYIRVGPRLAPGRPPCFGCYYRRRLQHDAQRETTLTVHAAYDADERCGPVGHLPHHVRLAAGLVRTMLDTAGPEDASVAAIRLSSGQVSRHHVVPGHDCGRCAPAFTDPDHGRRVVAAAVAIARSLTDGR